MAYTIIQNQNKIICETQEEIIYRFFSFSLNTWSSVKRRRLDTTELNISGKDCRNAAIHPEMQGHFFSIPFRSTPVLRTTMVLDEYGRPVDVREWTEAIRRVESGYEPCAKWCQEPDPMYRKGPCGLGRKRHDHCICGPAMWHRTYRNLGHTDYLEDLDMVPTRTRGLSVRKPEPSHSVEKTNRRYSGSKSWKDQSKSCAQWGKHKRGAGRNPLRSLYPNDWDVCNEVEDDDMFDFL